MTRDFGPFELQEKIGAGGMATVYLATQKSLGRRVVLKILYPHLADDRRLVARFEREARAAAQLRHESIVQVIDYGSHEGLQYIALEFVQGVDLKRLLETQRLLPVEIALALLRDMFLGLEHAHENRIVHRDIKPSNLMLTPAGLLKIMDFGLARRSEEKATTTIVGTVTGTPAYMSPEQTSGEAADERSDIFSAGVVAYELLGGRRPFGGESYSKALHSILTARPDPLDRVNPLVPSEIAELVHSMLEKDPDLRCASIHTARVQIDKTLQELGVVNPRELLRDYATSPEKASERLIAHTFARSLGTGRDPSPARTSRAATEVRTATAPGRSNKTAVGVRRPLMWLWVVGVGLTLIFLIVLLQLTLLSLRPTAVSWAWVVIASLVIAMLALAAALVSFGTHRRRSRRGQMADSDVSVFETVQMPLGTGLPDARPQQPVEEASQRAPTDLTQQFELSTLAAIGEASEQEATGQDAPASTPNKALVATLDAAARQESVDAAEFPAVALILIGTSGSMAIGTRFSVSKSPFSIGRAPESHLCLESDLGVSRMHAEITYTDRTFWIEDQGSSNGTWLDGRRVKARTPLSFGSIISVGSCKFNFAIADSDELPSLIDTVVVDRYVLKRLIRRTARSLAYEADDRRLPKKVVVKILAPHLSSFPQYVESFRRESNTSAQLSHPHIARTIDSGTFRAALSSGREIALDYYCVERFDGGSLTDILARNERSPLEQVARWLADLADAVGHAHRQGIVHGGIKPSAILLDGEGNAYLTDFAFASRAGEAAGHILLGAPEFIAPEQWDGRPLDTAVDQYALAVLAYLLVAGTLPFEGQEKEEVRRRNFERGPSPVHLEAERHGRTGVPRSLSPVLSRALSHDAGQRFPSIHEFAVSLRRCLARPDLSATGPRVFVSYRRESGAGWANLIAYELKQRHGIEAFVDTQRLDSAGRFTTRIRRAIEECDVFICLLSSNTLQSKYVCDEVSIAHSRGKPMIPVLQESFQADAHRELQQPHLDELLAQDGVHLLDERNIHVAYTIDEIARLVRTTMGGESDSRV